MLRSNGIYNEEILFSVEKLPPHYYKNLLGSNYNNNNEQNYFDELVRLLKILQYALAHRKKINNVLISNFKLGWYLIISSLIAKRIYSICSDKKQINDLEKIYKFLKITNIYIKNGEKLIIFNLNKINHIKIHHEKKVYHFKTGFLSLLSII